MYLVTRYQYHTNMQGHFIEQQLTCESHGWSNSVDFTLPVSDDMLSLEPYLVQLFSEPYENVVMTISKIPNDNSRKWELCPSY